MTGQQDPRRGQVPRRTTQKRRRRSALPPPLPPPKTGPDPILVAAVGAMIIVGFVVVVDLWTDGKVDPSILALLVSVAGPLTPALILRSRGNGNGK